MKPEVRTVNRLQKGLVISHPLQRETVVDNVRFVEDNDKRQFVFIQYGTGVHHIAHKRNRRSAFCYIHNV